MQRTINCKIKIPLTLSPDTTSHKSDALIIVPFSLESRASGAWKPSNKVTFLPSRSQWPRSVRHEMSPPAQTLGSWVRIPLEAWMSVCVYSVFVLGSGLATG
jgi:hypothetical protein